MVTVRPLPMSGDQGVQQPVLASKFTRTDTGQAEGLGEDHVTGAIKLGCIALSAKLRSASQPGRSIGCWLLRYLVWPRMEH